MTQFTEGLNDQIKELSKNFRNKIVDSTNLNGNCFTVCYPLSIHLYNSGFKNSLGIGKYNGIPHYWLNLTDYNGMVIDPTIKQFGNDEDDVFVGDISSKSYESFTNSIKERIIGAREGWKERLLYDGYNRRELEEVPRKSPPRDIASLLKINLTAAVLVITETEKLDAKDSYVKSALYPDYYNDIVEVLKVNLHKNRSLIERLMPSFPKEPDTIIHRLYRYKQTEYESQISNTNNILR